MESTALLSRTSRTAVRLRLWGRYSVVLVASLLGIVGLAWPGSAGAATVTVTPGETLTQIARNYDTTVTALTSANGLSDPNTVEAGTVLQVPSSATTSAATASSAPASPSTVVVTSGQSLWSIANQYGTTVAALASANGIADTTHVLIGAKLVIPAAFSMVSTPTAVTETAATTSSTLPPALLARPDLLNLFPTFRRWSSYFGVSAPLLEGMCWWESGWQSGVVSPTGAVGVGQLEPITVLTLTNELGNLSLNPDVASDNIEMAAAYLQQLLVQNGGNESLALADYYQGRASVTQSGMLPSTQQYVNGVLGAAALFT